MGLAMLTRIARATLGNAWRPARVEMAGPKPQDTSVYRRFFGVTPRFDCDSYRIFCRKADADRQNPYADASLARYARQVVDTLPMARRSTVAHDVRAAIYQGLQSGDVSLRWVAARIGEAPRTVQRRLAAEGSSFSELTHEVRRTLATRYLDNPGYSILQISEMLGYAQSSAFARWFVSQFGCPASRYRAMARGDEPRMA
jgi:AraC-like DNA-binding protein